MPDRGRRRSHDWAVSTSDYADLPLVAAGGEPYAPPYRSVGTAWERVLDVTAHVPTSAHVPALVNASQTQRSRCSVALPAHTPYRGWERTGKGTGDEPVAMTESPTTDEGTDLPDLMGADDVGEWARGCATALDPARRATTTVARTVVPLPAQPQRCASPPATSTSTSGRRARPWPGGSPPVSGPAVPATGPAHART